jgi:hypothetical protein
MTGVAGRVFVWQGIGQRADGAFEVGQVFVHGGLQDRVGGIEVPMGEVVAHPGDLPPRDRRLRGQQVIRECFNSLADLKQGMRTASKISPSDRSPRGRWERIASIAAWISASRWRSR